MPSTTTSTTSSTTKGVTLVPPGDLTLPRSVLTFILLIAAVLLAVATGKLVEYCVRRRPIGDDVSDISEYTRELLKQQILLTFGRKRKTQGVKQTDDELARKYANKWRETIAKRKVERARALKANRQQGNNEQNGGAGGRRPTLAPKNAPTTNFYACS